MTWEEALDAYARHLEAQADAIADGDPTAVPTFSPPTGLGPLPEALVPRVQELLAEANALEEALELALAGAGRELATVRRAVGRRPAARAAFMDQRV